MKKYFFSVFFVITFTVSYGQLLDDNWYDLNFEDSSTIQHIRVDTLSNPNNLWQIGIPQKTVFSSAFSSPKAILTDTINSYPTNDTSVFEIVNLATGDGWWWPHTVILSGYYYVNSDSLVDYGKIEISPDNGLTWIDLINDTSFTNYYYWATPKPILTGNSNSWQYFYVNVAALGPLFNVQYYDTILYRFTFISDSINTNKDGLMFDDFHFEDYAEGIPEIKNNNLITISPNPASDLIKINTSGINDRQTIQIFNSTGQLLYENLNFTGDVFETSKFCNGIYLLKYSNTKNYSIKMFVVQH